MKSEKKHDRTSVVSMSSNELLELMHSDNDGGEQEPAKDHVTVGSDGSPEKVGARPLFMAESRSAKQQQQQEKADGDELRCVVQR